MNRKSVVLILALLIGLSALAFGVARAQQSAPAPTAPPAKPATCPCMQGGMMGMMGRSTMGNMGQGMMGMQSGRMGVQKGMMPMCPLMLSGANVEVKNIDHGATITITSADAKTARRVQLLAEMMRIMHELHSEQ